MIFYLFKYTKYIRVWTGNLVDFDRNHYSAYFRTPNSNSTPIIVYAVCIYRYKIPTSCVLRGNRVALRGVERCEV